MKEILDKRSRLVRYHLKEAKSDLARMYWIGRADELRKIRREIRKTNAAVHRS